MPELTIAGPLGPMTLIEEAGRLVRLDWREGGSARTALLLEAERQLGAWFAGRLTRFDLPFAPQGSPAQQRFCAALLEIPYGETRSYGQIAKALGISAQAAGQLCGGNPLPVLIPCHRVLGRAGLGGFSAPGGVEAKVLLLRLEGAAGLLL